MTRAELKRIQKLPLNELHDYLSNLENQQSLKTLDYAIKCMYAIMCKSLHKQENFGKARLERVISRMEEEFKQRIPDADQLTKEVKEQFGIVIRG